MKNTLRWFISKHNSIALWLAVKFNISVRIIPLSVVDDLLEK